jgi:hypothetical protein
MEGVVDGKWWHSNKIWMYSFKLRRTEHLSNCLGTTKISFEAKKHYILMCLLRYIAYKGLHWVVS